MKSKVPGTAIVKDFPGCRHITLSRPGSLNSITLPMMRDLHFYYFRAPPQDPSTFYIVRGEGDKSFSAGGDVLALTDRSRPQYGEEYYRKEYQLDHHIATMSQRQISMWRGIVLGSGVGVSLHGSHRIACERTRFGMPETKIGTVPDVGTTHRLAQITPRFMGAYMCLLGQTISGADVKYLGLATHYVPTVKEMDKLEDELIRLRSPSAIEDCLQAYTHESDVPPFTYADMWDILEKSFTITETTTISSILEKLKADGSPFARATTESMMQNSPLAMTVALENFKVQAHKTDLRRAFEIDYNLASNKGVMEAEFEAGVDALLVSKSGQPTWQCSDPKKINIAAVRRLVERGRCFKALWPQSSPLIKDSTRDFFL